LPNVLAPEDIRRITPPLLMEYAIKGIQAEHGLYVSVMLDCEEHRESLSSGTGKLFITDNPARKRYCVRLRNALRGEGSQRCAECDLKVFELLKKKAAHSADAETHDYECPGGLPTIGVPIIEKETGTFLGAILAGQKRPRENPIWAIRRFHRVWRSSGPARQSASYARLLWAFLQLRESSADEQALQRNVCEELARQLSLRYTYVARQRMVEEQHTREQVSALAISSKLIEVREINEYWGAMQTILDALQAWLEFDWGIVLRDGSKNDGIEVVARYGKVASDHVAECTIRLSELELREGVSSNRSDLGDCLSARLPRDGQSWYWPLRIEGEVIGLVAFGLVADIGGSRRRVIEGADSRLHEIHNLMEIEYKQILALVNERERRTGLEASERELSHTIEKLNSTLVILTHQMSRPFIGVIGVLTLLRDSYQDVSPKRLRGIIDTALAGTRNTSLLALGISRVLAAEKSGILEVHPTIIDAHSELQKLTAMMKLASGRDDIDIEFVGRCPNVRMDRESFHFVFYNLLDNALKYGKTGTRISLASEKEHDRIALKVKSRGIRIQPSDISNVFEKFWRASAASRTGQVGLGIGCWAARKHMLAHGGDLTLEVDGDLSIFIVYPPDAVQEGGSREESVVAG